MRHYDWIIYESRANKTRYRIGRTGFFGMVWYQVTRQAIFIDSLTLPIERVSDGFFVFETNNLDYAKEHLISLNSEPKSGHRDDVWKPLVEEK